MVAEKSARSAAPRIVLALLVGGLVGFSAGYFAGGGGRPASESAGSASGRETGGGGDARLADLTRAVDRDPENPALLIALGNYRYDRDDWDGAIAFAPGPSIVAG